MAGLVLRVPAGGRLRRSAPYGRQAAFFWRWRPPTPAALAPSRFAPYAHRYARLRGGPFVPPANPPRFLRTSRPALARVAALACCVRSGAARPAPLRGPGPAYSPKPGPPPGPSGRGSLSSRVCALSRSVLALGPASLCSPRRLSRGYALPRYARPRCRSAAPPGRVARPFLSGPSASRLRGRLPPAPGPLAAVGRLFPAVAPGLYSSRTLRCGARLRRRVAFLLFAPGFAV